MRIGLVCPYDMTFPGGVQTQVSGLERHLTSAGHQVLVVAPGRMDLGRVRRLRANQSYAPIVIDRGVAARVRAAVAGCDVLHVHEPLQPMVSVAALGAALPTVATFHADPPALVKRAYRAMAPVARRRLGGATATAVSPVAASGPTLLGLTATIVPNGVEVPEWVPDARGRAGIVFVGRDDPRKGLPVLLSAMRRVRQAVPGTELTLIGVEGSFGEGIRALGRVDDAARDALLRASSILVAPNTSGESFGLVVAEGMAAGCAVVCSDLPAFTAVGGDAVRTVSAGQVGSLAHELIGLLGDQQQRAELGTAARSRVRRFSWANVAGQYLSLYSSARAG